MIPKRSQIGSAGLLAALLVPPPAAAQIEVRPDTGPVVATSGTGTVSLPPDRAIVFFAVQTRGRSAALASQQNTATVRRVLDSLKSVVSTGDSVEVPAVHVTPVHSPESGQINGYEANSTIRVALKTLDRLPRLLDAGLNAGVTNLQSINFESERMEAGRNEALARAYRQARASAESLARAAGLNLGSLVRLSSEGGGFEPPMPLMQMRRAGGDMEITPQNVIVQATVHVTWRLTR